MNPEDCANISSAINLEAEKGNMLPKTSLEVEEAYLSGTGFPFYKGGKAVAFVAVYEASEYFELGSAVTLPDHRHRGYSSKCLHKAIRSVQDKGKEVLAFTNSSSTGLVRKMGFRERNRMEMPKEALLECKSCLEAGKWPNCHCRYMAFPGKVFGDNNFAYSVIPASDDDDFFMASKLFCDVFAEEPWCEEWTIGQAFDILKSIPAHDGGLLYFAVHDGKIIGAVGGFPVSCPDFLAESHQTDIPDLFNRYRQVFYCDELFVAREYRRHGVGRVLSEYLKQGALEKGSQCLVLRTNKSAKARELYKSQGFVDTGIEDKKFPDRTYWIYKQ